MTPSLDVLIALERATQKLRRASELLHGVPDHMRALHEEFTTAKNELEALALAADEAGKERRAFERSVADSQEKLKKYQQQVSRVRNQREYGALLAEIDTAKVELRGFEEKALAAMERGEEAQRSAEAKQSSFTELESRYQAGLAAWESEKPRVAADVREVEREVAELRASLPKPLVAQFDRIFDRYRGATMAPVRRTERAGAPVLWHCGVCNFQVRSQVALEIRGQGRIVQCEGCKRFLFTEETP